MSAIIHPAMATLKPQPGVTNRNAPLAVEAIEETTDQVPVNFPQAADICAPGECYDVITIIRDPRNALGKSYAVNEDGTIDKKATVAVSFGLAVQRHVPSAAAMADVLSEVSEDTHAALVNAAFKGIPVDEEFIILSEKELAKRLGLTGRPAQCGVHQLEYEGRNLKAVGRFLENVKPSSWQLLDRDVDEQTPGEFGQAMGFDAWLAKVDELLPGVAFAPRVRTGSSSARVLRDGHAIGAGNGHVWVQIRDAQDVKRLRLAIQVKAAQKGMAWRKLNKRGTAGVLTTIIDTSVLIPGRLVFCGRPTVGRGFEVLPQDLSVDIGSARVDTSKVQLPIDAVVRKVTGQLGSQLSVRNDGLFAVDTYDLSLATEIELEGGELIIVADAMERLTDSNKKLRCQTPFRASTSVAGVLGKSGNDGKVFLFDVGSGTTHWLCLADHTVNDFGGCSTPATVAEVPTRHVEAIATAAITKAAIITIEDITADIQSWDLWALDKKDLASVVLADLVKAKLCGVEEESALALLKDATGFTLKALRADLAAARRRGPGEASVMVSPEFPIPTARALVKELYTAKGVATLRRWQDEFFQWDGTRYRVVSNEDLRAKVYALFERAKANINGRGPVDNTMDALRALVNVPSQVAMPAWLNGAPPAPVNELIGMRNGLLRVTTGDLLPHTPQFFTQGSVDVEYDPRAAVPALWLKFMDEAFPGDQESIDAMQQWFGYLLTSDTSQQKMLMCVGPKRCGKGTIARVLRSMLGEHNCTGPTLGLLGSRFGVEGLIGKSLAVISDARVSRAADLQAVSETLLRITGEDAVSVERKGTIDWVGRLQARFVMMTNTLPGIIDAGGAVGSRFIVIKFTESFFGREDTKLTDKLMAELPGILLWALEGLKALQSRGSFIQPATGLGAVDELMRMTTPMLGFIADCFTYDPESWIKKDDVYQLYKEWVKREGMKFTNQKHSFFAELYSVSDGRLKTYQPRVGNRQIPAVKGLKLSTHSDITELTDRMFALTTDKHEDSA